MVDFVSHPQALQSVLNSAARRVVTQRAQEVLATARSNADPESRAKQGALRYTVDGRTYRDLSARVGTNDPTILFEEEGTRPHIIRPRNGRALRFPGTKGFSGRIVHAAVVHHPGTRGSHFLKNALRSVIGRSG